MQRDRILDAALQLLRKGGTVSLESAARATGLTKPGLMYHFPTKEALMLGLVDHVVDCWQREIEARLGAGLAEAPAEARCRAYLQWALSGEVDQADLVMLTDPRLRGPLTSRWVERIGPWLEVPASWPEERRARLTAVRLLADGVWYADATGVLPPDLAERSHLLQLADELLGAPR